MTNKTLLKAKTIYNSGGVLNVYPHRYVVESTSGELYTVETDKDCCSCPATVTCSHLGAVAIYRAHRRRRIAAKTRRSA